MPRPRDRPLATRDGTWVRSHGEQRIADFLSRRGVAYEYEPEVAGLRPDFVVAGTDGRRVVIEYWGMAGEPHYEDRMATKAEAYEAAGLDLISVLPINLDGLERMLAHELRRRGVLEPPR